MEHLALTGEMEGERARGRQREIFTNSLNSWINGETISNNDLIRTFDRKA